MKVTAKTLDLPPERPSRRRVITFYSYKGGTGRSMALTNVAWMLALNGERVLAIDWDLEAPGLHRYFRPFLKDKELTGTEGLLDFVEKKAARSAVSKSRKPAPERATPKAEPGYKASTSSVLERSAADEAEIIDYLTPLVWPNGVQWQQFGPRARIDLLPAGRQGPAYSRTLNAFNWIDFFERLDGRSILQTAREQLRSVYDYILIDSRTGVSDSSGICTVEMPDTLVVCFTLNDQSIVGASGIAESVLTQRQITRAAKPRDDDSSGDDSSNNERPFSIFPVPMRVDVTSEHAKRQVALELVQDKFSHFLDDTHRRDLTSYWGSVQMAYYPYYAFEEIPSVFGDTPNVDFSLTNSVKKITGYLTDQAITGLPALDSDPAKAEQKRKEIVGWFARAVGPIDPVALAQAVFDQYDRESQDLMMRVLLRLVHVSPTSHAAKSVPLKEVGDSGQKMVDALAKNRILNVGADPVKTVSFTDPIVVEKWRVLNESIQRDQSFLLWRQKLDSLAQTWAPGDSDESALLRGRSLDEARGWLINRLGDLNEVERSYVDAGIKQEVRQKQIEEKELKDRELAAQERERIEKERRALKEITAAKEEEALQRERVRRRRQLGYILLGAMVIAAILGVDLWQNKTREAEVREAQARMTDMQKRLDDTLQEFAALEDARKSAVQSGGSPKTGTDATHVKSSGKKNNPASAQTSKKLPQGVWTDSATGLIWAESDNGENVTWTAADSFCRELKIGNYSSGWRLPKIDELKSIFDPKHDYQYTYHGQPYGGMVDGQTAVNLMKAGVELNSCCAWSSETTTDANKLQSAYYYRFQPNPRDDIRNPSIYTGTVALIRALCVHDP